MEAILKAEKRNSGSRFARALRRGGRIPASIQHTPEAAHVDISIDEQEFMTARRKHVHLYDIEVADTSETVIVRELQWDTFGQSIIHIEFRRVVRGQKIESVVELLFEGIPKTGQLNHLVTEIEIASLPSLIPDNIEVPIGDLDEGATITAADLQLPEGVELKIPADTVIAVIRAARIVEETTEDEDEVQDLEAAEPTPETPSDD